MRKTPRRTKPPAKPAQGKAEKPLPAMRKPVKPPATKLPDKPVTA